jgi:Holliday junction resolvasome RuvABC DNA-binding subunit
MIEYIKGELTELTPALATVEAAGVGYGLNISLNTFSAIQGKKEVKLYVYEAIREDAYVLYGFVNKKEREMFELLITVNGVGANTARMMLSGMSVPELCNAISTGNARLIQSIKGIGKMTAQRICWWTGAGACEQSGERRSGIGADDAGLLAGTHAEGGAPDPSGTARPACGTGGETGAETDKVKSE